MDDVQHFLLEREAENNLALGLLAQGGQSHVLRRQGIRCLLVQAGRRAALSKTKATTVADLQALSERLPEPLVSLTGPPSPTREVMECLAQRWNLRAECKDSMRLYRLTRLSCAPGEGTLRTLQPSDEPWLTTWMLQFYREALPFEPVQADQVAAQCRRKLQQGDFFGWQVAGQWVSMAAFTRPSPHGVCLSSVFTPPALRGSGYARSISAALSQRALDTGKSFCVLYADLDNPASNRIYQQIGYRELCVHDTYYLEPASTSAAPPHPR